MTLLQLLLSVLALAAGCGGMPEGPPAEACRLMRPQHSLENGSAIAQQDSLAPVRIVLQQSEYSAGDQVPSERGRYARPEVTL